MKAFSKLKKPRYIFFMIWITLTSNSLLGSNMSQFSSGRPLYLLDYCANSNPGYSYFYVSSSSVMLSILSSVISSPVYSISVCHTNKSYYIFIYDGTSGSLKYSSGGNAGNNNVNDCINNVYADYSCLFRRDN